MLVSEAEVQRQNQIREDTVVRPMLQSGIGLVLEHLIRMNAKDTFPRSSFHSHTIPSMSATDYVNRIVRHSGCSCEALVAAVMLMHYHVTFSGHKISVYNVHRVFLISVILAAKSEDDVYYTNSYYCKVGGISIQELRTLELSFIVTIGWDCWLEKDSFDETYAMLEMFASTTPDDEEAQLAIEFWMNKQSQWCRNRRANIKGMLELDNAVNDQRTGDNSRISPASPVISNQPSANRLNLETVADAAPFFPKYENSVKRLSCNDSAAQPNQGVRGTSGGSCRTSVSAGVCSSTASNRQTPVSAAYIPRRQKTPIVTNSNDNVVPCEDTKTGSSHEGRTFNASTEAATVSTAVSQCNVRESKQSSKTSLDDGHNGPSSGDAEENEDPVVNAQNTTTSSNIVSPYKENTSVVEMPNTPINESSINNSINNRKNIYTPGDFGGGFIKSDLTTPMKPNEYGVYSPYDNNNKYNSDNNHNNNRLPSKTRFSSLSSLTSVDEKFNIIGRSHQRPGYPNFYPTGKGRRGGKKHNHNYDRCHKSHSDPYTPTTDKGADYSAFGSGFGPNSKNNNSAQEPVPMPNYGIRLTNEYTQSRHNSNDASLGSMNSDVGNDDANNERFMKLQTFTERSTKQKEGVKGTKAKKRTMPVHWQEDRY